MNINRSGYYKWKARKGIKNRYEKDRELLTEMLNETHMKYRSYGYHRLATVIRQKTSWIFSDNLSHKCCKLAKIQSKARHYKFRKTGEEHILYSNRIHGKWNATRPLEIVASDMTCLRYRGQRYEWTYLLDTYNNEIISSHISSQPGDRRPYFACLADLMKKMKEQKEPVVLHTDQGSVYSSRAFTDAHKDYNIIRYMSRAGTPTDNPKIESLNGWIKSELITDFRYWECENIYKFIEKYVYYFNNQRPAYALNYKSPVQYRTEQGFA
jgi:transposase InsO family protein